MSTENILLFSVFIVYTKTLQAVGEDSLAAFSVFILSYRCPAKEPDSDIGIYTLFSRLLVRVVGHVATVSLHTVVLLA